MPGLVPPVVDERACLLAYLAQQRDGIRYAAHGLSDEQAMARPSASELNLGGLIKHAALVEQSWIGFIHDGDTSVFLPQWDWADGFRLTPGETLADVLRFSADVAEHTEKTITVTRRPRCPLGGDDRGGPLDSGRLGVVAVAGSSSTSLRRQLAMPVMRTSSESRWTGPRAGH